MTEQISKEQAVEVLQMLTAEHANNDYFIKAEVVSHDIGFGVDLRVDKQKWQLYGSRPPPRINKVPICVLVVG